MSGYIENCDCASCMSQRGEYSAFIDLGDLLTLEFDTPFFPKETQEEKQNRLLIVPRIVIEKL